jgi:signal transduction histidine kinase
MQSLCAAQINYESPHVPRVANVPRQSSRAFELSTRYFIWKLWSRLSAPPLAVVGLSLIPLVGIVDYAIGPQISAALFYIPPVAMAAWFGGRRLGLLAAIASAAAEFTAAIPISAEYATPLIHWWNATSRLLVCSMLAVLFSAIRKQRDGFKLTAEERAAGLEREIADRKRLESECIDIAARKQRQIAHHLHDNLGQHLVSIAVRTKLLEEKVRPVLAREADELLDIVRLTNGAVKETKLTARNLDAAESVDDLKAALQRLVSDMRQNCNVDGLVKADSRALPVTPPIAGQLYRIAQQAVQNAVEHGATERIHIDLTSADNEIVLSVRDNGRGFDASAATEGMGLRTMRYRAQRIGGSCDVQSARGGTTVTCRVPMYPAAA